MIAKPDINQFILIALKRWLHQIILYGSFLNALTTNLFPVVRVVWSWTSCRAIQSLCKTLIYGIFKAWSNCSLFFYCRNFEWHILWDPAQSLRKMVWRAERLLGQQLWLLNCPQHDCISSIVFLEKMFTFCRELYILLVLYSFSLLLFKCLGKINYSW